MQGVQIQCSVTRAGGLGWEGGGGGIVSYAHLFVSHRHTQRPPLWVTGAASRGHPRAHVGFSHASLPPQHLLPLRPPFPLPGGPSTSRTLLRCPHHGSRHTLSHPGSPAQSHTHSPHSWHKRGPSLAPLFHPTPPLRCLTALWSRTHHLPPKSSTSLPFLVPTSRSHQVPFPFLEASGVSSLTHLWQLRPTRHTPSCPTHSCPVPSLLFKMQIWYCHSLLQPCSGFLCP